MVIFRALLISGGRVIEARIPPPLRSFVGIRMFWENAAFYAATIYIAIAMSSHEEPVRLSRCILNIERCLMVLEQLERFNPLVADSFTRPMRCLLSLVGSRSLWVLHSV